MKKNVFVLALLLLVLCAACGKEDTGAYQLYFPRSSYLEGAALGTESVELSGEEEAVESLMSALLAGPTSETLVTPFPRGVTLRSWYLRESVLYLNLSEQYGGLSGIALTLADCSIALTLCQLEEVEGVSITVENDPLPFRYRQIMTLQDLLLPSA